MVGLIWNYSELFKNSRDFVSLCYLDFNNGATLTAALCSTSERCGEIKLTANGQETSVPFFHTYKKEIGYIERPYYFHFFKLDLKSEDIEAGIKISFDSYPLATYSAFPMDKSFGTHYCFEGSIMYIENEQLVICPLTKAVLKKCKRAHKSACKATFKKDRGGLIKAWFIRFFHNLCKPFFCKDIWLISDRKDMAGDNGEAFFEYIKKNPQKNVKACFVLNKGSRDYKRMKKLGKVLSPRTFKYKLYYTFATKIIASQLEYDIVNPFSFDIYLKDILNKRKIVFLQHGIIKDDLSPTYNRYSRKIDMFVTSTEAEYISIANSTAYGFGKEIVKLTGLARFDKLQSMPSKIVFIAPSWRKYCLKDTDSGELIDNFKQTPFFGLYNSLLHSQELIDTAKKTGYSLCFYPHFLMRKCKKELGSLDPVFVNEEGYTYADMFKMGELLFTDYSSIQFDFAYLKKPVIYCQSDKEEFFGSHTYVEGYFSYEKDGFGPVTYTAHDAIKLLCDYMERGCALESTYEKRIDQTFRYRDSNNCKRILDEVLKLDNGKN